MAAPPEAKYVRFNLDAVWDSIMVPLLANPRVKPALQLIANEILYDLGMEWIERSLPNRDFLFQIRAKVQEAKTKEEQYAMISDYCPGRFLPMINDYNTSSYSQAITGKYDHPLSIGYYRYADRSTTVMLLWQLCRLAWPAKTWSIVDCAGYSEAVMCEEEPTMVYTFDLADHKLGKMGSITCHANPVQYYAYCGTNVVDLPLPISLYTLTMHARKVYGDSEEEYDGFMDRHVRHLLQLQDGYRQVT